LSRNTQKEGEREQQQPKGDDDGGHERRFKGKVCFVVVSFVLLFGTWNWQTGDWGWIQNFLTFLGFRIETQSIII